MTTPSSQDPLLKLRQLEALVDSIGDHLWVMDTEARYVAANPAFLASINMRADQVIGKNASEVFDDARGEQYLQADLRTMAEGEKITREDQMLDPKTGQMVHVELIKTPIRDANNLVVGLAGIARDTTARINAEQALRQAYSELYEISIRDHLTQCFNRRHTLKIANEALDAGELALVMMDIDHFKKINDQFGHPAGDAVLIAVTGAMLSALASLPTHAAPCLGRLGGEEFCVLLPEHSLAQAQNCAEVLRREIEQLRIPNQTTLGATLLIQPTASFGVSTSARGEAQGVQGTQSFERLHALLHRADDALYQAKKHGRNRVACAAL